MPSLAALTARELKNIMSIHPPPITGKGDVSSFVEGSVLELSGSTTHQTHDVSMNGLSNCGGTASPSQREGKTLSLSCERGTVNRSAAHQRWERRLNDDFFTA